MKRILGVIVLSLFAATAASAGAPKSYQVTGPVLEVKDDIIVVDKNGEKWELARDKDTKVIGDLKAGSKVTIKYQMKAVSIEAKEEKAKGKKK